MWFNWQSALTRIYGFESHRLNLRMSGTENHSRLITLEITGSTPVSATVAVADLVMHRIVAPEHAGSTPVGHPMLA